MRLQARHYRTGQLCDLVWERGRILKVDAPGHETPDVTAGWVAPALFDLQINGGLGVSFNSPALRTEDVSRVVELCQRHGVAGFCPTVITQSPDGLRRAFLALSRARTEQPRSPRALPAFHLEGPYISPEDGPRGAHPRRQVRPPDWEEFRRLQEAAEGLIRLVTLAPETNGALAFIEKAVASGCVVAIGHTAASPATIRDAVHAGARLSTHLGNGSHAHLPRHENFLWEQLDQDQLWDEHNLRRLPPAREPKRGRFLR